MGPQAQEGPMICHGLLFSKGLWETLVCLVQEEHLSASVLPS